MSYPLQKFCKIYNKIPLKLWKQGYTLKSMSYRFGSYQISVIIKYTVLTALLSCATGSSRDKIPGFNMKRSY
jgi:ABC-type thiamin/hydroxymethylpyrimidine transport system permease subunit